jgi:2-polyprenyl-6-methoxyphenol hydroxylase-like FAD-dependent oxidoreductase
MDILVSGAGVAGLATALNLGRQGHRITVVERAPHFRLKGTPIDIRGDAVAVAKQMGILDQIREHRVRTTELSQFVDSQGKPVARVPMDEISDSDEDIEIAREDLARILIAALPNEVTIRFSESVAELTEDRDGVVVDFSSGGTERFELVLGADGQHSTVRRLVFGPERDWLRHLGLYIALADLPGESRSDRLNPMYNFPGRMAGIARYKDKALAVFMFRSDLLDFDYHNLDAQKKIVIDAYSEDRSWKIPELLDAVRNDPELYLDSVSQIHLPTWHRGRVALVGDAAHCAALLSGRGTSLALSGAHFLAEELQRPGADHATAFGRYEARQRPYVEFAQRSVEHGGDLLVPATAAEITARNARLRRALQPDSSCTVADGEGGQR